MRKGIAIFFLCIMVFTTTEAKQLLKLPFLIEHYLHHKHVDATVSLITFIKMHYSSNVKVDDDFADDMKLPFKAHLEFAGNYFVTNTPTFFEDSKAYFYLPVRNFPVLNSSGNLLSANGNIWQPPRI